MGLAEKIYEKMKAAPEDVVREVLDFIGYLEERKRLRAKPRPKTHKRSMRDYEGCLKDSEAFKGDPVEIQRKMRAEWDREWDE